jgi:hypothetical protein
MASLRLRSFTNLVSLKAIEPKRLLTLLQPYKDYFKKRGFPLPHAKLLDTNYYERLIAILSSPTADTPPELLDTLFLIDEMAHRDRVERLFESITPEQLGFGPNDRPSPADVACEAWLRFPDLLGNQHASIYALKSRSFEFYQAADHQAGDLTMPGPETLRQIEAKLDQWFEPRLWGKGSRVLMYPSASGVLFLIRHGQPFRREESYDDGQIGILCYRPVRYDVVIYDQDVGELRINATSRGQRDLYRRVFGEFLFGSDEYFPGISKYTLEPLRTEGRSSMACGDVEGIDRVQLSEVHILLGGIHEEIRIEKASDLFQAMEDRDRELPHYGRLVKAVLKVKFAGSPRVRSVTIRPPNVAIYTRDGDASIVEPWLQRRGFITVSDRASDQAAAEVLASA